jgi:hypothetical protein
MAHFEHLKRHGRVSKYALIALINNGNFVIGTDRQTGDVLQAKQ